MLGIAPRAVRRADSGVRRAPHQGGDAAALSARRRRSRHHAALWLRRGHQRAGRGRFPSARCATWPSIRILGGEVMVVSLGCEKLQPVRLLAGDDLPVLEMKPWVVRLQDEQYRMALATWSRPSCAMAEAAWSGSIARRRVACPASELSRRPAMRRQRRVLRRDGESRRGLCGGPAGARRRDRDVFRSDRGARRRPSAHARARQRRRWRGDSSARWHGMTNICGSAGPTAAPTPRPATSRAAWPTLSRRRWARSPRRAARRSGRRWPRTARRVTQQGPGLRRHSGQRFHLRNAATRRRHEHARLHHRRRHALRTGDGAGDQGRVAHRAGRAMARSDRRRCRAASRPAARPSRRSAGRSFA